MDPDLLTPTRIASGAAPDLARRDASDTLGAPSHDELDHDYLWRVHHVVPRRGELGIVNRSHREEAIAETSTGSARWHVVPADRRWVCDAVVVT